VHEVDGFDETIDRLERVFADLFAAHGVSLDG
jgi:hypothetical protein